MATSLGKASSGVLTRRALAIWGMRQISARPGAAPERNGWSASASCSNAAKPSLIQCRAHASTASCGWPSSWRRSRPGLGGRPSTAKAHATALQAKGLAPIDVVNAINAQNLILPTGTAKLGELEHAVRMNGSPDTIDAMNQLPVRSVNGAITYLREVAHVRDGFQPQVNIVKQNGERGVLLVNTGTGKGKTSASMGVMARGWARGWTVCVVQFMKSEKWKVGERKLAEHLELPAGGSAKRLLLDVDVKPVAGASGRHVVQAAAPGTFRLPA